MAKRAQRSWHARLVLPFSLVSTILGCREAAPPLAPEASGSQTPAPVLSTADEALLASLLAEDPGDFHGKRARIWRIGPARWTDAGPELPGRSTRDPRADTLGRPLEAVVIEDEGPRVLLPLAELTGDATQRERWSALHFVAVLSAGDLVAGLKRELRPTPWLTVSAGVGLTPLGREEDHLRVRWSEPACGFTLELALDTKDFGPLYEPGPSGSPSDPPDASAQTLRLAPGTAIFAAADAREPVLRLDAESPSHGERMSGAQRVTLTGDARRGRQPITLRCRGVEVRGFVDKGALVDSSARYAVVADAPATSSSCAGLGDETKLVVPRATPLYEPARDREPALVGVVREDLSLPAKPGPQGWWTSCVPSPWGDLVFQFRLR